MGILAGNMRSPSVRVWCDEPVGVHAKLSDERFRGEGCCYIRDTGAESHIKAGEATGRDMVQII